MIFTIMLFLAFAFIANFYYEKLQTRINKLEDELYNRHLSRKSVTEDVEELPPEIPIVIARSVPKAVDVKSIEVKPIEQVQKYRDTRNKVPAKKSEFWLKLEEQFAGNLIGVIGTLAVVMGIIFLAVYAAIQMGPTGRFAVICAFSVLLYCLHLFLKRKDFWLNISLWMRSASGIIFLVGCLGSIGIESMKWIDDPTMALAVLCLGLAANLIMGFLNGGQVFASVHVLISLVALVFIPLNPTIFFVSAIISTVGILMSYKDKLWDKHVIATGLGFFAIHFYWLNSVEPFPVTDISAMAVCLLVGLSGILSHYRKIYSVDKINSMALMAHLVTWGTLGINLYAHSKGSDLSSAALLVASLIVYLLSIKAKKQSVGWLLTSDRLISLVLILLATLSLKKFGLSYFEVTILGAIISLLFVRIVSQNADPLLEKTVFEISTVVTHLSYAGVAIQAGLIATNNSFVASFGQLGMIALSFVIFIAVFPAIEKKALTNQWGIHSSSYLGLPYALHGFIAVLLSLEFIQMPWLLILPLTFVLIASIKRSAYKNIVFDVSVVMTSLFIVCFGAVHLFIDTLSIDYKLALFSLMIGVGVVAMFFNWIDDFKQKIVWPGVFLLWLTATLGAYVFIKDQYPLLVGVIWLMMAMIACGIKHTAVERITGAGIHEKFEIFVSWAGIASITFFLWRFFVFDIQSEQWIGQIRVRVLIELFALLVVAFWWFDSRKSEESETKYALNFFLEIFLALGLIFTMYEVENRFLSLVLISSAFLFLFLSKKILAMNRLVVYSLFMYVLSLVHIGVMATTLSTPSIHFYDQAWIVALGAIALGIVYLVIILQQKVFVQTDSLPSEFSRLNSILSWLRSNDTRALIYPLIISVALFLIWGFSHSLLSLLLIVECFTLFIISIVLRQQEFRIISMGSIAAIFVRIIFYDLTGKDFFLKAIVFITVGAILIAMNAIYNKYKHRYQPIGIK